MLFVNQQPQKERGSAIVVVQEQGGFLKNRRQLSSGWAGALQRRSEQRGWTNEGVF